MEQQTLMRYSRHIANDFWFEFDVVSAPSLSLDVRISNDYATLFPNTISKHNFQTIFLIVYYCCGGDLIET